MKPDALDRFVGDSRHVLYHVVLVALSAGIALSLPTIVSFAADRFQTYWSLIESDPHKLVLAEIAVTISLICVFNLVGRSLRNRHLARVATGAGLTHFFPNERPLVQKRSRRLKEMHGLGRTVMIIGSTGYRTFVDPRGDLHAVLNNCLEAKVMLLHPESDGARIRARALQRPGLPPESFREQITKSIEFLKKLKSMQRNVKLKLYGDEPHLKLNILGDHMWVQHYHSGCDVHLLPEYVCRLDAYNQAFYTIFYQYFLRRWDNPNIPEYDLETDELVYRDHAEEVRRVAFASGLTRLERTLRPGFDLTPWIESRRGEGRGRGEQVLGLRCSGVGH